MCLLCVLFVHETTPFCFRLYMAFKCPTMRFTCLVSKLSTTDIKAAYGAKKTFERQKKNVGSSHALKCYFFLFRRLRSC